MKLVVVGIGLAVCVATLLAFWATHPAEIKVTPVAPAATLATAEIPIILMGLHDSVSDPFFLSGGTYHGIWSAWGESPVEPPCTHSVALVAADPSNATESIDLADLVQVPSTGVTQETDLVDVSPGDYYLVIISACAWQVQLSSQE